jgi:tetratricopeptide (TPR) repeat protein
VKKQQWVLIGGAIVLFIGLLVFGKTVSPKNTNTSPQTAQQPVNQTIKFEDLLQKAKEKISPAQSQRLMQLESAVVRGDVKEQQLQVYRKLAGFWADSAHIFEPYAYYTAEAAKLENSEKSLTFAAHLFLDNLMTESQPAMRNWLAVNAKVLLEKALVINPANESSKIGLGACYIFGNISDNPMQGIAPIMEIVQKDPDNVYAQMILGLGGKKSGQYDKAIERFELIVKKHPDNMEATLNMAESYDLKGDKINAIKWYEVIKKMVNVPEAKAEIDKRITELKK